MRKLRPRNTLLLLFIAVLAAPSSLFVGLLVEAVAIQPRWGSASLVLTPGSNSAPVLVILSGKEYVPGQTLTSTQTTQTTMLLSLQNSIPNLADCDWEIVSSGPLTVYATAVALTSRIGMIFGGDATGDPNVPVQNLPDSLWFITLPDNGALFPTWSREFPNVASIQPSRRISSYSASIIENNTSRAWFFGGTRADDSGIGFNELWEYDVDTRNAEVVGGTGWTQVTAQNGPPVMYDGQAIATARQDLKLYFLGGVVVENQTPVLTSLERIWVFTPGSIGQGVWEQVTFHNPPPARRGLVAVYLIEGNSIWISGGRSLNGETVYSDSWILDLNTQTWSQLDPSKFAPDPSSQWGGIASLAGDTIVTGFGYGQSGPASGNLNVYSTGQKKWLNDYTPSYNSGGGAGNQPGSNGNSGGNSGSHSGNGNSGFDNSSGNSSGNGSSSSGSNGSNGSNNSNDSNGSSGNDSGNSNGGTGFENEDRKEDSQLEGPKIAGAVVGAGVGLALLALGLTAVARRKRTRHRRDDYSYSRKRRRTDRFDILGDEESEKWSPGAKREEWEMFNTDRDSNNGSPSLGGRGSRGVWEEFGSNVEGTVPHSQRSFLTSALGGFSGAVAGARLMTTKKSDTDGYGLGDLGTTTLLVTDDDSRQEYNYDTVACDYVEDSIDSHSSPWTDNQTTESLQSDSIPPSTLGINELAPNGSSVTTSHSSLSHLSSVKPPEVVTTETPTAKSPLFSDATSNAVDLERHKSWWNKLSHKEETSPTQSLGIRDPTPAPVPALGYVLATVAVSSAINPFGDKNQEKSHMATSGRFEFGQHGDSQFDDKGIDRRGTDRSEGTVSTVSTARLEEHVRNMDVAQRLETESIRSGRLEGSDDSWKYHLSRERRELQDTMEELEEAKEEDEDPFADPNLEKGAAFKEGNSAKLPNLVVVEDNEQSRGKSFIATITRSPSVLAPIKTTNVSPSESSPQRNRIKSPVSAGIRSLVSQFENRAGIVSDPGGSREPVLRRQRSVKAVREEYEKLVQETENTNESPPEKRRSMKVTHGFVRKPTLYVANPDED